MGAKAFFEKPVDYKELKRRLALQLEARHVERRSHVRVRMPIILRLREANSQGERVEVLVATQNVSAGGFLCNCSYSFSIGTVLDVFLMVGAGHLAGRARVVRVDSPGTPWQRYGFQFLDTTSEWLLR